MNNPETSGDEYLAKIHKDTGATYTCGQLERGAQGTLHLQFFLNFHQKARISKITGVDKRIHCEPVKVNNGADTYCMKSDTRVEGPWEFGDRPFKRNSKVDWDLIKNSAQIGDLDSIPAQIYVTHYPKLKAIAKDHMVFPPDSDHLKGIWIYGPSGVGKSRSARKEYPGSYPKLCNKWWDGYQGQKTVIMDDLGPDHECLAQQLKIWTDHYSCLLETKGGAIPAQYDWFIVTSQYSIEEIFKDHRTVEALLRRFKVIHMLDDTLDLVQTGLKKRPPILN